MRSFFSISKNRKAFTTAELLVTLAVLLILLSLAVPSVTDHSRKLHQKELDDKAEILYGAVQNRMSQLYAQGSSDLYGPDRARDLVNGSSAQSSGIPGGDHTQEELEDFASSPLYYATSLEKNDPLSAAFALMGDDAAEQELFHGQWVIEYSPDASTVYAVYYSPSDEPGQGAAAGYTGASTHNHYDQVLRSYTGRLNDLKKDKGGTGYYGACSSAAAAATSKLSCSAYAENADVLMLHVDCRKPAVDALPAFQIELADNEGNSVTRFYRCQGAPLSSFDSGADVDREVFLYNVGSRYSLDLVLDDVSSAESRFVNRYEGRLVPGTELTITVTAFCPDDASVEAASATVVTNSLYAGGPVADASAAFVYNSNAYYSDGSASKNRFNHNDTAVIANPRHLVNLDEAAGAPYITRALLGADLDLSSYPYFDPIVNPRLTFVDGNPENGPLQQGIQFRILGLKADAADDAGLFARLEQDILLCDLELTGARVRSSAANAGALCGRVLSGNVSLENCRVFLLPSDCAKADHRIAWIRGAQAAGGLIGLAEGGHISIDRSFAATVIEGGAQAAGLVCGSNTYTVELPIQRSYSDSYVYGSKAAAIASMQGGQAVLEQVYGAGYVSSKAEGAGLVLGKASMTSCYTIANAFEAEGIWYSTASEGSAQKVFYLEGASEEQLSGAARISAQDTAFSLRNKLAGSAFTSSSGDSRPYNLMDQGLSAYTDYPTLIGLKHYGDWSARFQSGALVYFEKYSYIDGNGHPYGQPFYGFEGGNIRSTLLGDVVDGKDITVLGDGIGVVLEKDGLGTEIPWNLKVSAENGKNGSYNFSSEPSSGFTVISDGTAYVVQPFGSSLASTPAQENSFWYKAFLSSENGAGSWYYLNPHFGKAILAATEETAAPVMDKDSVIAIRTPRHLYDLSLWHDQAYRINAGQSLWQQQRPLDYSTYDWNGYAGIPQVRVQEPIGQTEETAFSSVYDGQTFVISNVGFETQKGSYAGLFGVVSETGAVRNAVAAVSYIPGRTDHKISRREDMGTNDQVFLGVLAGLNKGHMTNCAAAGYSLAGADGALHAYTNSRLYAGGFVGANQGYLENCQAAVPQIRIAQKYAVTRAGGFTGLNDGGTIRNCYALGTIEVVTARGGETYISGFAGENKGRIYDSYCCESLTASGETTRSFGFAPRGGAADGCFYLNEGTYRYAGTLYPYNAQQKDTAGKAISYNQLKDPSFTRNALAEEPGTFCCSNTDAMPKAYPFRAVVKNADPQSEGSFWMHFGDWQEDILLGSCGAFYWELEEQGSNNGYHMTFIGAEEGSQPFSGTSLCNAHDDGGVITSYGYGFYVSKGMEEQLRVSWENLACSGIADKNNCSSLASSDLKKQMEGASQNGEKYTFYAYTTGHNEDHKDSRTGKPDYLYLSGTSASNVQSGSLSLTLNGKTSVFRISPFFANAISLEGAGALTARDGSRSSLSNAPGTEDNPFEIRSAEQLQYINWSAKARSSLLLGDGSNYKDFNFLQYANTLASKKVTRISDISDTASASRAGLYWRQSHDARQTAEDFVPISGTTVSTSASSYETSLNNWFGGHYDGQSYILKNISISTPSFAAGLFGTTVSADIRNVILYSDNGSVIERRDPSNRVGAYSIGGLIGIAYDYNVDSAKSSDRYIENCAISGYTVRDASSNQQGLGEANLGGLIGVANVNLRKCSAAVDLDIACTHSKGSAVWGIFLRVGGLTGAAQGLVTDCYSGGSAFIQPEVYAPGNLSYSGAYASGNKFEIHMSGLAGSAFTSNFKNFTGASGVKDGSPSIENCYTYFRFPEDRFTSSTLKTALYRTVLASRADRINIQSGNLTMNNCYYLDSCLDLAEKNAYVVYGQRTLGTPAALTYDQLCGKAQVNGVSILQALKSPAWGFVTNREFSGFDQGIPIFEGALIDGVFTFPSDPSLDGRNYPFPAVLIQNDLTYGTASAPVCVRVHYGDWPIDRLHWQNARDGLDIFEAMGEDGFAYKTFRLLDSKEHPIDERTLKQQENGAYTAFESQTKGEYLQVVQVGDRTEDASGNGYYPVTLKALKKGSDVITADLGGENKASMTVEITASLVLSVDGQGYDARQETLNVTREQPLKADLLAFSTGADPLDYSRSSALTWTLQSEDEDRVFAALAEDSKNGLVVTRSEDGDVRLCAKASYDYHGEIYSETMFLTAVQIRMQELTAVFCPGVGSQAEPVSIHETLKQGDAMEIILPDLHDPEFASFAREGWIFEGWSKDGDPKILAPKTEIRLTENAVFTARWKHFVLQQETSLENGKAYLIEKNGFLLQENLKGMPFSSDLDLMDLPYWTASGTDTFQLSCGSKKLGLSLLNKLEASSTSSSHWTFSAEGLCTTTWNSTYYLTADTSGSFKAEKNKRSVITLYTLQEEYEEY